MVANAAINNVFDMVSNDFLRYDKNSSSCIGLECYQGLIL